MTMLCKSGDLIVGLLFALSVVFGCKEQQEVERILTVDAGHLSDQEISIYDIFEDVELVCLDSSHPIPLLMTWDMNSSIH